MRKLRYGELVKGNIYKAYTYNTVYIIQAGIPGQEQLINIGSGRYTIHGDFSRCSGECFEMASREEIQWLKLCIERKMFVENPSNVDETYTIY